jgi:hypothetical protein
MLERNCDLCSLANCSWRGSCPGFRRTVLDGDHRLIGESLDERDLLFVERLGIMAHPE